MRFTEAFAKHPVLMTVSGTLLGTIVSSLIASAAAGSVAYVNAVNAKSLARETAQREVRLRQVDAVSQRAGRVFEHVSNQAASLAVGIMPKKDDDAISKDSARQAADGIPDRLVMTAKIAFDDKMNRLNDIYLAELQAFKDNQDMAKFEGEVATAMGEAGAALIFYQEELIRYALR